MWSVGSLGPLNHDGFPILFKDDPSIYDFHELTRLSRVDAKRFSRSLEKGACFAQPGNQSIGTTLTIPLFTHTPRDFHLRMAERASLSYGGHDVVSHLSKHSKRRLFNSCGKVNPVTQTQPNGSTGIRLGLFFSLVSRRIWDFVEKFFLFSPSQKQDQMVNNIVMSMSCNNHRTTGTAIAFMNGKKGRGNGDNSRDHSSYEPSETSCAVRNLYLRHTHLPDSVPRYRKRVVKKGIRTTSLSVAFLPP